MKLLIVLLSCFLLIAPAFAQKNRTKANANSKAANANTELSPTPATEPTRRTESSSSDTGGMFYACGFFVIALYFLPMLNAIVGKHHNAAAISLLNILLGWTVIGWIVAFVWSATKPTPRQ